MTRVRSIPPLSKSELRASQVRPYVRASGSTETASHSYPVLMLPVRLETRFVENALLVRIYPDQLAIETHEIELTQEEVSFGRAFLEAYNDSTTDQERRDAWRGLAARFGTHRAAWIARQISSYTEQDITALPLDAWQSTPTVRVMPDRFLVSLYREGVHVPEYDTYTTPRIPDELSVLRDPKDKGENDTPTTEDPNLFDEASRWVVDFNEACSKGMAVRILLHDEHPPPFSHVIAVGMKSASPDAGVALLENMLESQHYTSGLAFLPYGSPTNNTSTAKSVHSQTEQDLEHSYDVELAASLEISERSNGARLLRALGLSLKTNPDEPEALPWHVFQRVGFTEDTSESFAEEMHALLWPASGGYFLKTLLGDAISDAIVPMVKDHFVRFVRGRGPLPTLRIGNLPYGVLPVGRLAASAGVGKHHKVDAEELFDTRLRTVLRVLSHAWLPRANSANLVPRIGGSDDPEGELLGILAMEPQSVSCSQRPFVDERFVGTLLFGLGRHFFGPGTPYAQNGTVSDWLTRWMDEWQASRQPTVDLLERTGVNPVEATESPLLRIFGWGKAKHCDAGAADEVAGALVALCKGKLDAQAAEQSLFAKLLYCALQLEPDKEAFRKIACDLIGSEMKALGDLVTVEDILHFLNDGARARSKTVGSKNTSLAAKILEANPGKIAQRAASLDDAAKVMGIPPEMLRRTSYDGLMREALDSFSHRLDAWITSCATRRLDKMRNARPSGVYLGAYGWVEGALEPDTNAHENNDPDAPPEVEPGFIHAPSLGQATAAAVARSAYLTHEHGDGENPFRLDITSDRTDMALNLIKGVRNGRQLGAFLGGQFEDALHRSALDRYIDDFRAAYPLASEEELASSSSDESTEAALSRTVVDGLALADAVKSGADPIGAIESSAANAEDVQKLRRHVHSLRNTLDAFSDLLGQESLYQAVHSNHERSGAAIDAASGAGRPPEIESMRTPTPGIGLAHRVCVILSAPEGPDVVSWGPRATAEPRLAEWFSSILGPLSDIACQVQVGTEPPIGVWLGSVDAPKLGLDLDPLDFLYLSALPASGEQTDLERLIVYRVLQANPPLTVDAEVRLELTQRAPGASRSVSAAMEAARRVLGLFSTSSYLKPEAFYRPDELPRCDEEGNPLDDFSEVDLAELETRVSIARNTLVSVVTDLALDSTDDKQRAALLLATRFGIQNAIPSDSNDPALAQRARSAREEASRRLAESAKLAGDAGTTPSRQNVDLWIGALKALFGEGFVVLPVFEPSRRESLAEAIVQNGRLDNDAEDRVMLWLQQVADTHPAVRHLENTLMVQQAWSDEAVTNQFPELRVVQLPFDSDQPWQALSDAEIKDILGLAPTDKYERPRGVTSIVALTPSEASNLARVAGLLVDQWSEVIPIREISSGLSFQYDSPGSQAPSAMLLAVPSDIQSGTWTPEELRDIVRETADLARIRLVDPDALRASSNATLPTLGGVFPALFLPNDPKRPGWKREVELPGLNHWRDFADNV